MRWGITVIIEAMPTILKKRIWKHFIQLRNFAELSPYLRTNNYATEMLWDCVDTANGCTTRRLATVCEEVTTYKQATGLAPWHTCHSSCSLTSKLAAKLGTRSGRKLKNGSAFGCFENDMHLGRFEGKWCKQHQHWSAKEAATFPISKAARTAGRINQKKAFQCYLLLYT